LFPEIHPQPPARPTKKILIIEDDAKIAAALEARLRNRELVTFVAADAISGSSMAVHQKPDLIIIDISLPGGNGLKLAEQFCHLPETSDTPFIFITASKDSRLRARAMQLRAAGFLEKPYDPEELLALASHALAKKDMAHDTRVWRAILESPQHYAPKKILIIEDDQRIALGLQLRLRSIGYETICASDALTGMNTAARSNPDLVLLDISMPGGNGFDLAQQIQKSISDQVPIIFLTASKRPDFKQKAEELGAFAFFEKPYEAEALLGAIRKALNGQSHTTTFTRRA
jgi:two-component system, cell cycle response regulator